MKKIISFVLSFFCTINMTACGAYAETDRSLETAQISSNISTQLTDTASFTEVPEGSWYEAAIQYCQQQGIMNGTSSTTFSPDAAMTRSMLATVLYRMSGSPTISTASTFSDVVT